ncbi:MAG: RecX family transcriptional regulator, partial [Candidatus Thiodiazotropha sp.]
SGGRGCLAPSDPDEYEPDPGLLIDRYMEIYEGEWRDLLVQVHHAKFGSERAGESKELAKRARFLEYRGFPGEMIRSFLLD